jgi:hypothetical protein
MLTTCSWAKGFCCARGGRAGIAAAHATWGRTAFGLGPALLGPTFFCCARADRAKANPIARMRRACVFAESHRHLARRAWTWRNPDSTPNGGNCYVYRGFGSGAVLRGGGETCPDPIGTPPWGEVNPPLRPQTAPLPRVLLSLRLATVHESARSTLAHLFLSRDRTKRVRQARPRQPGGNL